LTHLLPPALAHPENLDHPNEDVDEVQFKRDGLVDGIFTDNATLSEPSMLQDLLDVVQREAAEDSQATVQPQILGHHQCAGSGGGDNKRSKAREGDNGDTGEEGTAEVEVLLLLSRGTNEGDGAHHADCVETGTGEKGGLHEHEWREEGSLGDVESRPECVLLDVAVGSQRPLRGERYMARLSLLLGVGGHATVHGADAADETDAHNKPRVGAHQAEAPSAGMQLACCNPDDANAEAGVKEGVVQVGALVRGHTAVLTRLPVEDQVDGQQRATKQGAAVEQPLRRIALCYGVDHGRSLLLIAPSEGRAKESG
jgi:hypothetical protein